MEEVSCRAFDLIFNYLGAQKIDLTPLLAELPFSAEHILNGDNRVSWDTYRTVVGRTRALCPDDQQWIEMGRAIHNDGRVMRPIAAVCRFFGSPRMFMKWMFNFGGFRLFSNMYARARDDEGVLVVEHGLRESYEPAPEYFLICRGVFQMVPQVMGFSEIPVEMNVVGRDALYRLDFHAIERKNRFAAKMRTVVRDAVRLLRPKAAVLAEFERSQVLLEQRYGELSAAKQQIEEQQRALELVHEVAAVAHESLQLAQTVDVIAEQIQLRLFYDTVRVHFEAVQDGVHLEHEINLGDGERRYQHRERLGPPEKPFGEVEVSRAHEPIDALDVTLLQSVLQSTQLALNNAVAYEVIRNYRSELEQKVTARTVELERAKDALARSLESRNRFFANVNHELCTPLTVLFFCVDGLAALSDLPPWAHEKLASMKRNAEQLQGLVDDLLLLSAGAEDLGRQRLALIDVGELVRGILDAHRPRAMHVELCAQIAPGLSLEADPRQVERALGNLVGNALKYTKAGRVQIGAGAEGDDIVFTVEDTGSGISADYLPHVFERFLQVPHAVGQPGAGIGLALVREVAAQHRGEASVESELGKGSRFALRLPKRASEELRRSADASAPVLRSSGPLAPRPTFESGPVSDSAPRVLVCEDNDDLLCSLKNLLAGAGLRVDCASTPEAALAQAQRVPPDLLLTDIGFASGMDGLELCRQFKALGNHRNAPMLVLTAYSMTVDKLEAFGAGAVDYLLKPFNPAELLARVRAQLTLREMSHKLLASERLAAQGATLAGVAHELLNPLNGLINAIGPLRERLPSEIVKSTAPAGELLRVVEECGERVAVLSKDLLAFMRPGPPQHELLLLDSIVFRSLAVVQPKLAGLELRRAFHYAGQVRGASLRLSQVLINLLDNAAHFAGQDGWIELRTEVEEANLMVEVRDSGPGVPVELREKIFEPFFTTKPPGKGTGLGLSISREIAREHGGDLAVLSDGKGFTLRLPLPSAEVPA